MKKTNPKILEERKIRATKMVRILKKLYPNPKMALDYSNEWELLVAVVLSAHCTDKRVNIVTHDLFQKYTTLADYADADISEFEKDIYSTGFYKNKAKNIIAGAQMVRDVYNGEIPQTMEELLLIPGVARKTANVVLFNAFNKVEGIAVDTHVRRFVIRFNLSDSRNPKQIEEDLMEIFPKKEWGNITHRLINYGRDMCPAQKHDCTNHPLTLIYPKAGELWPKSK